ncbi:TPA: cation transporter, partial [Klebsiella pneumoniae]|nr:cation transporter [Klebsiella pneumoniae]HEL7820106.1 cation transporter [Klebsiella pneumoniae]
MAHSHSHSSVQAPDNSNARRLLWAFIVTAGFMLIEAVGGAISGSLALLAD